MREWISVKDRLPSKGGKYRIKGFNGSLNRKPFDEIVIFKTNKTGGRFLYGFDWCEITHWKQTSLAPESL